MRFISSIPFSITASIILAAILSFSYAAFRTSVVPLFTYISPVHPSADMAGSSSWFQKTLTLPARSRGSYLITDSVVSQLPEIKQYRVGILHLFIQHTSAALSMNENWDDDVRADMSDALDRIVPEDKRGNLYRHSAEGSDDMPAHIKSALIGSSVSIPISNGRLATGTWQGIWYLEFRAAKHTRKVVATLQGEKIE
jgi:secondary thiamine-phosphate synthase enzyme